MYYFSKNMVCGTAKKSPTQHQAAKNIIVHTETKGTVKQQSELLKWDFIDLLNSLWFSHTYQWPSTTSQRAGRGIQQIVRLSAIFLGQMEFTFYKPEVKCFISFFSFFSFKCSIAFLLAPSANDGRN